MLSTCYMYVPKHLFNTLLSRFAYDIMDIIEYVGTYGNFGSKMCITEIK